MNREALLGLVQYAPWLAFLALLTALGLGIVSSSLYFASRSYLGGGHVQERSLRVTRRGTRGKGRKIKQKEMIALLKNYNSIDVFAEQQAWTIKTINDIYLLRSVLKTKIEDMGVEIYVDDLPETIDLTSFSDKFIRVEASQLGERAKQIVVDNAIQHICSESFLSGVIEDTYNDYAAIMQLQSLARGVIPSYSEMLYWRGKAAVFSYMGWTLGLPARQ